MYICNNTLEYRNMKKTMLLFIFLLQVGNVKCQNREDDKANNNIVNHNYTGNVSETGVNSGKTVDKQLQKINAKIDSIEKPEGWDELLKQADAEIDRENHKEIEHESKLEIEPAKKMNESHSVLYIIGFIVILLILEIWYFMRFKNINKLGKVSEIIGKIVFYFLVTASVFVVVSFNLLRLGDKPGTPIIIGSILGNLLAVFLIYFFWRLLFRPIYSLNKSIQLEANSELNEKRFKSKWRISLICSLIVGLLFIVGTLGVSLLLMIPQYALLNESKKLWSKY